MTNYDDPVLACRFYLHDESAPYTFDGDQIQEFLDMHKVTDADGYLPTSTNWTPSYDVRKAAAEGWMWMAGEPINRATAYTLGDVSVQYDRKYCLRMAAQLYGSGVGFVTRVDEVERDRSDPRRRPQ